MAALLGRLGGAVGVGAALPVLKEVLELGEGVVEGQVHHQLLLATEGLPGGPRVQGDQEGHVVPGDGPGREGPLDEGQVRQGPAPVDQATGLGPGHVALVPHPGAGRARPHAQPRPRRLELGHLPGHPGIHPGLLLQDRLHGPAPGITTRITIGTTARPDVHDHDHS